MPPELLCRGVSPNEAAICLPLANCRASPTVGIGQLGVETALTVFRDKADRDQPGINAQIGEFGIEEDERHGLHHSV